MTSVLYRAKRKDNGEWVYGYYRKLRVSDRVNERISHRIYPADYVQHSYEEDEYYEIIPETVGRFLKHVCYDGWHEVDRIFQNDIVAMLDRKPYTDLDKTEPETIALVRDENSVAVDGFGRWFPQDTTRIRIIGNAYDNPELLKGHALNHFVNGLNDYPGDADEYLKQHRHLTDTYGIHGAHACCYMCNFPNDYICYQFNGGCKYLAECRKIQWEELKNG